MDLSPSLRLGTNWSAEKLVNSTYKDLGTPSEVENRFLSFLLRSTSCLSSIITLISTAPSTTRDFSIQIDAHEFIQADPILGNMLLRYPNPLLSVLEGAIVRAQKEVWKRLQRIRKSPNNNNNFCIKGERGHHSSSSHAWTRVHARLVHLPPHASCCKSSIASLKATDVGKIVQISGTVVRASSVQMYESTRAYKCTSKKCGHQFMVYADLEQTNNAISVPNICPRPECKNYKFQIINEGSVNTDYQEIKIQECVSSRLSRSVGSMIPRSLCVKLQHDLVDLAQPGDDVVIVGSMISQWKNTNFYQGLSDTEITMGIKAHSLRVVHGNSSDIGGGAGSWDRIFEDSSMNDETGEFGGVKKNGMVKDEIIKEFQSFWSLPQNKVYPIAARNFICRAVCPKLYGMSSVKLALLITLIGGCGGDEDKHTKPTATAKHCEHNNGQHNSCDEPQNDLDMQPEQFTLGDDFEDENDGLKGKKKSNNATAWKQGRKNKKDSETVRTRRREQSHMLIVGDPGTGKSQFLRFAAALCPRSIMTTGVGTTSAGLTCAAVREGNNNEFALEAGALVLADKGVCCIDEFGCIRASDRTTIHEAMEQQTLSIAKAGIVCKLNCRATIFAVCNPKKGIFEHEQNLTENTGIELPLLSRFDLIFKLIDTSDKARDDKVATFLLNRAIQGAGYQCSDKADDAENVWTIEKLRAYIATVKSHFQPTVSQEAALMLQSHYEKCRGANNHSLKITVRFLESLIRLSQAHARLMFRPIVTLDDAVSVILLMESSEANSSSPFDESSLHRDPMKDSLPVNPIADFNFYCDKLKILQMNKMENLMTEEEDIKYQNLMESMNCKGGMESNDENSYFETETIVDHYGRSQPSPAKLSENSPFGENRSPQKRRMMESWNDNSPLSTGFPNNHETDDYNIASGKRRRSAD